MKREHIKLNAIDFIDPAIKLDEKGESWQLSAYERRLLQLALKRERRHALIVTARLNSVSRVQ